MTAQGFYRASVVLPFLGMIPTLSLGFVSKWAVHDPVLRSLSQLSAASFFVGMFAAVPYLLYIAVVWKFFRPETESSHRRAALVAPIVVACVFVSIAIIVESASRPGSAADFGYAILVPGVLALTFGYFYVGVIELSLATAKHLGWIRPQEPPAVSPSTPH